MDCVVLLCISRHGYLRLSLEDDAYKLIDKFSTIDIQCPFNVKDAMREDSH